VIAVGTIDLAPEPAWRRPLVRRLRRGAAGAHTALLVAIVLAVFVQVYLIGAYVFGAGPSALDAHRAVGFSAHGLEVLVLVAALVAWLPRGDVVLSLLLAVLGTAQIALAGAHSWTGGLHALGAMLVLTIAVVLLRRARRARSRGPAGRGSAAERGATVAGDG
jgi:hypothetical protein